MNIMQRIFLRIKQEIYDFFNPMFRDMLLRFGLIGDEGASSEDIEALYALIESYKNASNNEECAEKML